MIYTGDGLIIASMRAGCMYDCEKLIGFECTTGFPVLCAEELLLALVSSPKQAQGGLLFIQALYTLSKRTNLF